MNRLLRKTTRRNTYRLLRVNANSQLDLRDGYVVSIICRIEAVGKFPAFGRCSLEDFSRLSRTCMDLG